MNELAFNSDGRYDNVAFPLFRRFWENQYFKGKAPNRAVHRSLGDFLSLSVWEGQHGTVKILQPKEHE